MKLKVLLIARLYKKRFRFFACGSILCLKCTAKWEKQNNKRTGIHINTVSVPMLSFNVVAESVAEGTHPDTLIADDSLRGSRCFALIRDNEPHKITLETRLQANDTVWYITPLENGDFARGT